MTGDQLRDELDKRLTDELGDGHSHTSYETMRVAMGFLVDYAAELITRVEQLEAAGKKLLELVPRWTPALDPGPAHNTDEKVLK